MEIYINPFALKRHDNYEFSEKNLYFIVVVDTVKIAEVDSHVKVYPALPMITALSTVTRIWLEARQRTTTSRMKTSGGKPTLNK